VSDVILLNIHKGIYMISLIWSFTGSCGEHIQQFFQPHFSYTQINLCNTV